MPAWRKLLAQLVDPLVYLLLAAVAISIVTWAVEGAAGVPFEAIVITVILMANAVLGYVQEARAEHAVAALQRMAAATSSVRRDGVEQRIPAAGESEPVLKDVGTLEGPVSIGDRVNMAFSGTALTRGRGRAIVTSTGMSTEIGSIAALLEAIGEEPTPLPREIATSL